MYTLSISSFVLEMDLVSVSIPEKYKTPWLIGSYNTKYEIDAVLLVWLVSFNFKSLEMQISLKPNKTSFDSYILMSGVFKYK